MKRIFAIIISLVFCLQLMPAKTYADDKVTDILFLGDSIPYGAMLSDGEKNYGEIMQNYYGSKVKVKNLAINGYTTADLLSLIQNEETSAAISDADVICVSIGGNDILGVFLTVLFESLSSEDTDPDLAASAKSLLTDPAKLSKFTQQLDAGANEAVINIPVISGLLQKKNSDAKIIFQTIYNPFEATQDDPNVMFIRTLYTLQQKYGTEINSSIASLVGTETADIKVLLSGSCWLTTNIMIYDIHPNQLGHVAIASELISMLSGGKKDTAELMPALTKSVLSKEKFNSYYNQASVISDYDLSRMNPIILNSLGIKPPVVTTASVTTASASETTNTTNTTVPAVEAIAETTITADTAASAQTTSVTTEQITTESVSKTTAEQTNASETTSIENKENPKEVKSYTSYYFFASLAALALIAVLAVVKKKK